MVNTALVSAPDAKDTVRPYPSLIRTFLPGDKTIEKMQVRHTALGHVTKHQRKRRQTCIQGRKETEEKWRLSLMAEAGDNVQERTSRGEGKGGTYQQLQTSGGQRKSVFGVCHVCASFGTFIHVNGHSLEEATCCAAGGRRVRLAETNFPFIAPN